MNTMKLQNTYIGLFLLMIFLITGCNEDLLDKTPPDRYSDAVLWNDVNLVDSYLQALYNKSLTGPFGYLSFTSLTDEGHDTHGFGTENYLKGNITASNTEPFGNWAFNYTTWSVMYKNIQEINLFLANIEKLPDAYPEQDRESISDKIKLMKGEAIFLRAFCYVQLARNYGGLVIKKEPFNMGDDYLSFTRSSFKETVDFIAQECDNAAELLNKKSETEMGRATKGAALTLKSRMLIFAASDLTADGSAENEFVGYTGADRSALWTAAKNAAKEVMDLGEYQLEDFGAPDQEAVAENYFSFFKRKDLSSNEVIWGKMFLNALGSKNQMNLINGSNGFVMYGCNAPTGNLVDAFEMEDGSKFTDHFSIDNSGYYVNKSDKFHSPNIYLNREPRFYGTILYDSAVWLKRFPDLADRDPLGIYDRRTRVTIKNGEEISRMYGIDTKQGPIDPDDGTFTGYTFKKFQDDKLYATETTNNENCWYELKYDEVLLNYAEACIGLNEITEATNYINMIRNRVGLPNFEGDITKALQYERRIEFVHEDVRWYDMRRWKILDQTITNITGVDIIETINKDTGTDVTTWRRISVQERGPAQKKMYWVPIPIDEINRAPQLQQNPGY